MNTTRIIKNFLRQTPISDFVLLMTAPVDNPAMKSVREESEKIDKKSDFAEYVFGNIILGQKN